MLNLTDKVFKYASAGLLVACLSLGAFSFYQSMKLDVKDAKIEALEAQLSETAVKLEVAININKGLNTTIETQNKSIKELGEKKLELEARLNKASIDATALRAKYEKRIKEMLSSPVSNDCNESLSWLRTKAPELSAEIVIETETK